MTSRISIVTSSATLCAAYNGCYQSNGGTIYNSTVRTVEWCGANCLNLGKTKILVRDEGSVDVIYCVCLTSAPTTDPIYDCERRCGEISDGDWCGDGNYKYSYYDQNGMLLPILSPVTNRAFLV